MPNPKRLAVYMLTATIILLIVSLAACGSHVHHDFPTNHGSQNGCHWVDTTTKHRVHKRIHGRWKYVTVKTHTKHLVCH